MAESIEDFLVHLRVSELEGGIANLKLMGEKSASLIKIIQLFFKTVHIYATKLRSCQTLLFSPCSLDGEFMLSMNNNVNLNL